LIDESILEGFTKLTDTVRRAVGRRIKDPFDLGIYAHIKMEAAWSSGIYHGNALTIAYRFGNLKLHPKIKRSMLRLRKSRLINYQVTAGTRGAYDVLVDGFQVTMGGLKGQYLNAWAHSNLAIPEYEDAACERPEDGLRKACERPEDGHTQDVNRLEVDDRRCGVDEAEAPAAALAARPSLRDETTTPKGDPDKTTATATTTTKASGNPPRTPDISSVCSVDEDELTECMSLWTDILGSSPHEDDFRELLSDGEFIRSLEQNEITLSFLFVWSQLTSDRFQSMKSSRDFRLEANSVLTRFINYVKTSSPRKVRQRIMDDFKRFSEKKRAEARQPQIQEAWKTIRGTELDYDICSRWSYLFDYDIEHFVKAFEYIESTGRWDASECDKDIEEFIKCACGMEQVVEDDEDVDWGDEALMPRGETPSQKLGNYD